MGCKQNTCCFSGHRRFPRDSVSQIKRRVEEAVDLLIQRGVTDFISGGAVGFDHICSCVVLEKKRLGEDIRLVLALPCRDHDKKWTDKQKLLHKKFLVEADDVMYISENYTLDCMKKRNFYMVDNSAFCICALFRDISGTGQTVRYAQRQGLEIINVAK